LAVSELTLGARDSHSFPRPQADQVGFELGESRQNIEEHFAHRVGGVVMRMAEGQRHSDVLKNKDWQSAIWVQRDNRALTGSNFAILATISRRLPSKFETQAIGKPTTLRPITSCNRPPRRKCLTYLPARIEVKRDRSRTKARDSRNQALRSWRQGYRKRGLSKIEQQTIGRR
jgi:hypothetical protein